MAKHTRNRNKHQKQGRRAWKASTVLFAIGAGALGALVIVAGVLAFTGGENTRRSPNSHQDPVVTDEERVSVDVWDNDYDPRDLTVQRGTTVTWKFKGKIPHTVTEDTGLFDSGLLDQGDAHSVTFEDPGEYFYYCTLHHAMQGKVTVAD